jgi:hypothetical protein
MEPVTSAAYGQGTPWSRGGTLAPAGMGPSGLGLRDREPHRKARRLSLKPRLGKKSRRLRSSVPRPASFERLVIRLPLDELWTSDGPVDARRGRQVGAERIKEILRKRTAVFARADIGFPLTWYRGPDAAAFWRVAKPNLSEGAAAYLDQFPGGFCYFATEWASAHGPVVSFEKSH